MGRGRSARIVLAIVSVTGVPGLTSDAGEILNGIKSRGKLRCGVSEGIPGFSVRDSSGRWSGLEVDFARAVAAAVLGDPEKVEFIPLKASGRFPALQARRIDLLLRQTSWTLTREALLKVHFPGILFYDSQAFMVPKDSPYQSGADLAGAMIAVEKGNTDEQNLIDYFRLRGLTVKPLVIDSADGAADALFNGQCKAYSSNSFQLAIMRLRAPGGPDAYRILPDRISHDPLCPAVLRGDDEWTTVVRWVLYALLLAEETGVTQENIDKIAVERETADWKLVRGEEALFTRAMGVDAGWAIRAVKAAGNYGEMYDRNLGSKSPLKLERGLNRLWNQGGLMYAPPID